MSQQKVVLITDVSSGIGRAMAQALAQEGYRVFGTSRDPSRDAALPGIEGLALDVRDDASWWAAPADEPSESFDPGTQIDLLGPGAARLAVKLIIGVCDRVRIKQGVGTAFLNKIGVSRARDLAVYDYVGDVHALRA